MRPATHEPFEIPGPDGAIDGVLCRPAGDDHWPGVLYLTDIGGVREAQIDRAARLAGEGYVVVLPNVFYRARRPPMFEFPRNMQEERSRIRFAELTTPLTAGAMARDADVYVNWMADRLEIEPEPFAVVGHCFTGGFALRVAAARPDSIALAASFHGGGLATESAASPHLLLPKIRAQLYFGHAVEDPSMPPEAIARLDAALAAWGGTYKSEVYAGAHHGWTASDGAAYNAEQAERAFRVVVDLLTTTLVSKH
jgi:carboxymethylenebutenolidase